MTDSTSMVLEMLAELQLLLNISNQVCRPKQTTIESKLSANVPLIFPLWTLPVVHCALEPVEIPWNAGNFVMDLQASSLVVRIIVASVFQNELYSS